MTQDVPFNALCDLLVEGATASPSLRLPTSAPDVSGRILVLDDERGFTEGVGPALAPGRL